VQAAPSHRNRSDTVASAGRKIFGSTATTGANSQTFDTNHGEFPSMILNSGAQMKIDASYQKQMETP